MMKDGTVAVPRRDHHPHAFATWMVRVGIQPGVTVSENGTSLETEWCGTLSMSMIRMQRFLINLGSTILVDSSVPRS